MNMCILNLVAVVKTSFKVTVPVKTPSRNEWVPLFRTPRRGEKFTGPVWRATAGSCWPVIDPSSLMRPRTRVVR